MTAQLPPRFLYQRKNYVLISYHGDTLPCPSDYGLKVGRWHTASIAGYVNTYALEGDHLVLHQIRFGKFFDDDRPEINGVKPRQIRKIDFYLGFPWVKKTSILRFLPLPQVRIQRGDWVYKNLRLRIPFTGGMLIGDGANLPLAHIRGPQDYQTVFALRFTDGMLTDAIDRSSVPDSDALRSGDWY